jgi:hypothetical protein
MAGRADIDSPDSRKAWRARNPEKDRAHRVVEFYIRRLRRAGLPMPTCEVEGCTHGGKIQAHHTDYSRPLDVVWLCPHHHISGHWNESWREQRGGKAITMIRRTIEITEEDAVA